MNYIFDLYGTLIDINTDESSPYFWRRFSSKTKKYYKYEPMELQAMYLTLCHEYQKEKEELDLLLVFKDLFKCSKEDAAKIAITFRKLSTKYIKLYKDVKKGLKKLKNEGNKIYLLSNAQNCFTMYELRKFKLIKFFDGIQLSSDEGYKKPNKKFFQILIDKYNLDINDSIMIGNDMNCDIKPAQKLGLKTKYIKTNLS